MDAEAALTLAILVAGGLLAALALRPSLMASRGGRILAALVFLVCPLGLFAAGFAVELDHATSTEFCLSCHEMEPYGRSLLVDDTEYVAANHFQNNRVPQDRACFTCHTDYTMFGDVAAKVRGLRHVWVHYVSGPPETIALYSPYQNRECLHCHGDSRAWSESDAHSDDLQALESGELSCLECHGVVHDVEDAASAPLWHPPSGPLADFAAAHDASPGEAE